MRKLQRQAVPAAHPAPPAIHVPAARRLLRLTARLWLPRPRHGPLPLDERVRLTGEW